MIGRTNASVSGSSGGNEKFKALVSGSITEVNSDDLEGVTEIKNGTFQNCFELTSVDIYETNITRIGQYAFDNCNLLSNLKLPETLVTIAGWSFIYCIGLTDLVIPKSVLYIENAVFDQCYNLTNIDLGNVREIGFGAFNACQSLTKITLPSTIQIIGDSAFAQCVSLTEITVLAETPPTLNATYSFPDNVTTIYIPAGTLSAYQTATNWSSFTDKFIELEETVVEGFSSDEQGTYIDNKDNDLDNATNVIEVFETEMTVNYNGVKETILYSDLTKNGNIYTGKFNSEETTFDFDIIQGMLGITNSSMGYEGLLYKYISEGE